MNKIQLAKTLSALELSKIAIQIYTALLNDSGLSISDMCTQTGVYRRKIYEAIEELKEIGLIERENDYTRNLVIKSPSVVHILLKNKQYEINKSIQNYEEILPGLLTGFYEQGNNPTIRVFDNTNKFIFLFVTILDEIESGSDMISYNESDDLYELLDHNYFFNIWVSKRIKKQIRNRILTNKRNSKVPLEHPVDENQLREFKILPSSVKEGGCYWVFNTKVILWDTTSPKAVYIENKVFADLMRNQFELIWEQS